MACAPAWVLVTPKLTSARLREMYLAGWVWLLWQEAVAQRALANKQTERAKSILASAMDLFRGLTERLGARLLGGRHRGKPLSRFPAEPPDLRDVTLLRRNAMTRKIIRVARPTKSSDERLLEVRRTVSEYVASVAIPPRRSCKRRRPSKKRSVTLVVK